MCLNETDSLYNPSDAFPIQKDPKQEDTLSLLLSNLDLEYAIKKVQENRE
jgi:hypothetical protein